MYDTLGNVWEWVNDWYDKGYYFHRAATDPQGPLNGLLRVLRGGSSSGLGSRIVRVSSRYWVTEDENISGLMGLGFRCVAEFGKAEQRAQEAAEQERRERERVESLARKKAEGERQAKEKAERDRLARARAEAERKAAEQAEANRKAAECARESPRDGQKYVLIPPGTFMMGCSPGDNECDDKEKPPYQVRISKGFWLGQTPVTVAAYKRFTRETSAKMPPPPDFNPGWRNEHMPIVNVSWHDAQAYCTWAGGRLPTEAEWEYAARGGSTEARYGTLDEVAWCGSNSWSQTHPVGEKRANGFGLYDMLGNVWEWVNDWYDGKYYRSSPSQDSAGPASGEDRVLRGGSWVDNPRFVRVSIRNWVNPARRFNYFGVRCAREVDIP